MSEPPVFKHIEVDRKKRGALILTVTTGSLLDDVAIDLRLDLATLFREKLPKKVVLDLHRVEAISSSGVGALISLLRRVRESGGALMLCGLTSYVRETLRLCKLIDDSPGAHSGTFAWETDVPAALAGLKSA